MPAKAGIQRGLAEGLDSRLRANDRTQGAPQRQPVGEFRENKSKKLKGNERRIAFISFRLFFRIGIFQWVMVDSNKKNPLRLNSRDGLWAWAFVTRVPHLHFSGAAGPLSVFST
jgi:hypothetical protein